MVSKTGIGLSVISVLVLSSFMSIPISFAATSVKVTGSFSVPAGCCTTFVYANDEIAGIGSGTVYIFSGSSNTLLVSIPIDSPQYILYDSVDKTVVVVGEYNSSSVTDIVDISTTNNKLVANVTVPKAYSYVGFYGVPDVPFYLATIPNLAPVAYDPHNDMIYLGSTICEGGSLAGLCQIAVVSAKTLSFEKTISFASHVGGSGEMWSIFYDSKNNELFASASDGYIDELTNFGALVTISDSTNKILSIVSSNSSGSLVMPFYLTLDTSNNLLYAEDVGESNIDVFNVSANGAFVATIGTPDCCNPNGIAPANYNLDGNLVSGMFYATGCYDPSASVLDGAWGCTQGQNWLNGTYYTISGTKLGAHIALLSGETSSNCFSPFWSGVTKLTYIDCGSKFYVLTTSTGKLQTTLNVQGTIAVFNRDTNMLWVQSGTTVYEIGT